MLFDAHLHLDELQKEELIKILDLAKKKGVKKEG